ncbi:MAG: DUF502 domain-containing protein [Candidatus Hydrogenedentales bacterium]
MAKKKTEGVRSAFLGRLQTTVRGYVLRGMLVLVPLGVTAYVLKLCYSLTAGLLVPGMKRFNQVAMQYVPGLDRYTVELPGFAIVLLSIVLFVGILYAMGLIAGLVLGRRLIAVGEWILARIPLVKTIYGASRQAVDVLSLQGEGPSYEAAALVPFPSQNTRAIAFITGKLEIEGEGVFYRTFVPTTPNPTSGYLGIYPKDSVQQTSLTVEDAAKAVMSAGILTPPEVRLEGEVVLDSGKDAGTPSPAAPPPAQTKRVRVASMSLTRRLIHNTRNRLVSGLLVLVPIGVTIFIISFIYDLTAGRIEPLARMISGPLPPYAIACISVALLLISLYITGNIATAVVGKRVIRLIESLIGRVPLITTIYGATKQIIESLIDPSSGPKFEAPALVEFPFPGVRTIGFVVGRMRTSDGVELYKVFVPTAPNITVGLLVLYRSESISGCNLTLEEAIKLVVSCGLVGSDTMTLRPISEVLKPAPEPNSADQDVAE